MKLCKYTTPTAITILFLLVSINLSVAQTEPPCGNVITPADFYFEGSGEQSDPIQNCANPFERTGDLTTLRLNNQSVQNNASYVVPTEGTADYSIGEESYFQGSSATYCKHSGQDLIRVNVNYFEPTRSDIETALRSYFNNNESQVQKYTEIYLADYRQPYFYDEDLNQYYYDGIAEDFVWRVYAFAEGHIEQNVITKRPLLLPGTYTVVQIDTDEGANPSYQPSLIQKIFTTIIPTAHAYYYVNTVTFTLAGPTPEPTGASSVLFLPGIQASRLYLGEDGVGGSAFERVWEPGNNSDVRGLAMNQSGESIQKIYSADILKTITLDTIFGYSYKSGSVYQGFFNFMNELVTDETIREWYPLAYDWRYDVFDIVKNGTVINQAGVRDYPVTIAQELASRSKSSKVTIIAHSNGGLLAKAIMIELERLDKESLVDKIFFLGTPQLGTPKALGVILHGYDQEEGGGFIINDTTARTVINNFPGAYALLPSSRYLTQTDTPVVSFDNSVSTALYRSTYGATISSLERYQNFLNGTAPENRSLTGEIYQPVGANSSLLATALTNHANLLDSWIAPSSTKVVSIIGTGIPTMKALRYEDVLETICPRGTTFSTLALCSLERLPRPFAVMTYFGDKTVTGLSAKGYAGTGDQYFVDLIKINADSTINRDGTEFNHANFTEVSYVQTLLKNLISTTTIPAIPFIINQEPVVIEPYIVQQIASPVYMSSIDSSGQVSGYIQQNGTWVLKEDIPGSQYFEFAGVKYLLIPSNTDFKTILSGQEFGGYTYKISELKNNDTQIILSQLVNASTTPTMIATLEKKNGQFSTIKTDYNGDTMIDSEVTVNGVVVTPQSLYTYQKLINSINTLTIRKSQKDALLFLVREAEKLDAKSVSNSLAGKLEKVTLKVLETTIQFYLKSKILTSAQTEELLKIVKFLSQ